MGFQWEVDWALTTIAALHDSEHPSVKMATIVFVYWDESFVKVRMARGGVCVDDNC